MGEIRTSYYATKIEKMRRAAARAAVRRLWSQPPMKVPPAWATDTPYISGDIRSSGGAWWVAANGGTSGATAPVVVDANNIVSDGVVQWLNIGGPTIAADEALLPSLTYSPSVAGGRTVQWTPANHPELFQLRGCEATTGQSDFRARTLNDGSTADAVRSCGIAYMTDAPILTISVVSAYANGRMSIAIDGRLVTLSPFLTFVAPNYCAHIDLTAMGGRRPRRIDLLGATGIRLSGVLLTSKDSLWKPEAADAIKAVLISDSQFAGHSFGLKTWGGDPLSRFADYMGWSDWWNYAIAGTGYTNKGVGSAYYNFGERVAQVLAMATPPDVVIFHGTTNDNGVASATITAAALAAYQALRVGGYAGLIVVFGVWPLSAACATTEAAIASAVAQFNDPHTIFIPISQAANPPITGSWNNTNYPTSGTATNNASLLVNSTDSIHLMEIAADPTMRWMADQLRAKLLAA